LSFIINRINFYKNIFFYCYVSIFKIYIFVYIFSDGSMWFSCWFIYFDKNISKKKKTFLFQIFLIKKKYFLILISFILLTRYFLISFRKKIFLIWIGLELRVFSTIPLFSTNFKKTIFQNFTNMFLYFFYQIIGSLIIFCGFLFKIKILFVLGVLLKLGVFPLIVWIPILLSSLDWFSFFFLMVLKKIPLFYLVYSLASGKKFVWIFLITILQGVLGLFFSKNNFKIFLCWSSVIKRSLICLVFLINPFYGWVYFFFYGILMFLICYKSSARNKDFSFLKTWKNSNLSKRKILITKFFLLILAGFPPFFWVFKKVFFYKFI